MRSLTCAVAVAVLLAGAALHASTLEEIEKAMEGSKDAYTSLSYTQTSTTEMKTPQFAMNTKSTSVVEMKKKGDAWLMRTETEGSNQQTMMGKTNETKSTSLSIMDTEWVYSLNDSNGVKMATKSKISKEQAPKTNMLDMYKKQYNLKALPDETIDGQDCFVLEATGKDESLAGMKMTIWFAKSCGMMMKMVSTAQQGATTTIATTGLKVNPSIADDRFVFKAPEGVTVQDLSQMQGMGGE